MPSPGQRLFPLGICVLPFSSSWLNPSPSEPNPYFITSPNCISHLVTTMPWKTALPRVPCSWRSGLSLGAARLQGLWWDWKGRRGHCRQGWQTCVSWWPDPTSQCLETSFVGTKGKHGEGLSNGGGFLDSGSRLQWWDSYIVCVSRRPHSLLQAAVIYKSLQPRLSPSLLQMPEVIYLNLQVATSPVKNRLENPTLTSAYLPSAKLSLMATAIWWEMGICGPEYNQGSVSKEGMGADDFKIGNKPWPPSPSWFTPFQVWSADPWPGSISEVNLKVCPLAYPVFCFFVKSKS